MRVNQRWWFWACPDCCGDTLDSLDPHLVKCIRCGITQERWKGRLPKGADVTDMLTPDFVILRQEFVDFDEAFDKQNEP